MLLTMLKGAKDTVVNKTDKHPSWGLHSSLEDGQ